jgi:hypothetical protein
VTAGTNTPLSVLTPFGDPIDQDHDTITKYQFWDSADGGGRFEVFGAERPDNTAIEVMAADLGAVSFVTGSTAGTDVIWARAFDGTAWSEWASSTITTFATGSAGAADQVGIGGFVGSTSGFVLTSASGWESNTVITFAQG